MLERRKERVPSRPTFGGGGDAGRTDADLMRGIAGGERGALGQLMDRYWLPLVRFAARSTSAWDEAEDMAQEVFVRVWRSRETWESGGSVRTYLYRIARNLAADRARHADVRSRSRDAVARATPRSATPVEEMIRGELQADLELALAALAPRRREAFILVRLQGLSLQEAGDLMDLTPRTVANHVYLAATKLAESLQQHLS